MANQNLSNARTAKNDEFYTQYNDIQREINAYLDYDKNLFRDKTVLLPCDDPEWSNFTKFFVQNFEFFGLKKLISTSYAPESVDHTRGKIFTLTKENYRVDYHHLKWSYLQGDGDFRSAEVNKLRDEADFIVTNPPFSMFRGFMAWLIESGKKFLIIGNINALTCKEIFPLIKNNKLWLGRGFAAGNAYFGVPQSFVNTYTHGVYDATKQLVKFRNCCWLTNIDHRRRHRPLDLMTMEDNIRYNKKLKGQEYQKYDHYDAIEIPYTNAIPSDYDGKMGVPISFLDKYCPEQFNILGIDMYIEDNHNYGHRFTIKGKTIYARIIIQRKTVCKLH